MDLSKRVVLPIFEQILIKTKTHFLIVKKLNKIHQFKIEMISSKNQEDMITFLKCHRNYSLFLLGNFENYGAQLGKAPYSGNYKLIRSHNEIIAVFCLTKKGSLLIQSIVREPIFDILLVHC